MDHSADDDDVAAICHLLTAIANVFRRSSLAKHRRRTSQQRTSVTTAPRVNGKIHTAHRPEGTRSGRVGYGPDLHSFMVYLMVVHFIPAHRCVALLESLTGAAPSVGFVHGMLERAAGLLVGCVNPSWFWFR